ncbi:MAG: T9SS type A sorting domain-containing protein, partial [Schleiferiaceae bacterium]
ISGINGLTGTVVVRNMMGQSVYQGKLSERDEGKVTIDLNHVQSGVYFIDLFNKSKHHIEKVLIQH